MQLFACVESMREGAPLTRCISLVSLPPLPPLLHGSDSVYLADMLLGFHTGFLVKWEQESLVIVDGQLTAWYYVRHDRFLLDLISLLPVIPQASCLHK
jgi:hypothetical protein